MLCMTSIVLYIAPEGRVAYWGNWTFFLASKSQWTGLHITGGLLFFITSLWHIALNWKPIVSYMKQRAAAMRLMPVPVAAALGICLFVYAGTLAGVPPMRQLVTWNQDIKEYQARVNGSPPFGHAELSSLEKFCAYLGFDLHTVLAHLDKAGLQGALKPETTILELAKANKLTPQQVFGVIREAVGATGKGKEGGGRRKGGGN